MTTSKDTVITAIASAKSNLERALADLEHLPVFDSGHIAFAAHALNNFLSVIRGTADLMLLSLKNGREPQLRTGLEGLVHAADLMMHTVNQLMNTSAPAKPRLIYERIDLSRLLRRRAITTNEWRRGRGSPSSLPQLRCLTLGAIESPWQLFWTTCFRML